MFVFVFVVCLCVRECVDVVCACMWRVCEYLRVFACTCACVCVCACVYVWCMCMVCAFSCVRVRRLSMFSSRTGMELNDQLFQLDSVIGNCRHRICSDGLSLRWLCACRHDFTLAFFFSKVRDFDFKDGVCPVVNRSEAEIQSKRDAATCPQWWRR